MPFTYLPFSYFLAAGTAFLVTLLITPFVKKLALSWEVVDKPGTRKIHTRIVPGMGGIGIVAGFLISIVLFYFINSTRFQSLFTQGYLQILAGGVAMMILGIVDDKRGLDAKAKFAVQFLVAILVVAGGLKIGKISNPFGEPFNLGILSYPLTVLWIVGITNAINLTDGLDGLASGIGLIVTITMFSVALVTHHPAIALLSAALSGALIGFLRYNFNPAQIFMGDTGSLFLGFMLAAFSIKGSLLSSTTASILTPFIALGLPIFDTIFAMVRRMTLGLNPFSADREHIHHRLLHFGLNQRQTVMILYLVSIVFGIIAFFITAAHNETAAGLLFIFAVVIYVGVQRLGYIESILGKFEKKREKSKRQQYEGIHLGVGGDSPFWPGMISKKGVFEITLDFLSIAVALFSAKILLFGSEYVFAGSNLHRFRNQLAIISLCCYASFITFGYYRDLWRHIDLNSIGKYVKGVTGGVLGAYFLLAFFNKELILRPQSFVVFWLFLLLFIVTSRVLLNFYSNYRKRQLTKHSTGEKVLIYGAGERGAMTLSAIIKENRRFVDYRPVGFIDDNPSKINRYIQGYKVLGDINNLEKIVRENEVQRVIISSPYISGQRETTLKEICLRNNITLCHFQIQFNALPLN